MDKANLVWDNTPDTPIVATSLSKLSDIILSDSDFNGFNDKNYNKNRTMIVHDLSNDYQLIVKKETLISLKSDGKNKLFTTGNNDIVIKYENADENLLSWGDSSSWYIYLCDQIIDLNNANNTAIFTVSRNKNHPQGKIPETNINYSENNSRLIGGFKSDSSERIISSSVWDIYGKFDAVKAKEYKIIDENNDVYRQLSINDIDTTEIKAIIDPIIGNTGEIPKKIDDLTESFNNLDQDLQKTKYGSNKNSWKESYNIADIYNKTRNIDNNPILNGYFDNLDGWVVDGLSASIDQNVDTNKYVLKILKEKDLNKKDGYIEYVFNLNPFMINNQPLELSFDIISDNAFDKMKLQVINTKGGDVILDNVIKDNGTNKNTRLFFNSPSNNDTEFKLKFIIISDTLEEFILYIDNIRINKAKDIRYKIIQYEFPYVQKDNNIKKIIINVESGNIGTMDWGSRQNLL